jgi:hypothetical protein
MAAIVRDLCVFQVPSHNFRTVQAAVDASFRHYKVEISSEHARQQQQQEEEEEEGVEQQEEGTGVGGVDAGEGLGSASLLPTPRLSMQRRSSIDCLFPTAKVEIVEPAEAEAPLAAAAAAATNAAVAEAPALMASIAERPDAPLSPSAKEAVIPTSLPGQPTNLRLLYGSDWDCAFLVWNHPTHFGGARCVVGGAIRLLVLRVWVEL